MTNSYQSNTLRLRISCILTTFDKDDYDDDDDDDDDGVRMLNYSDSNDIRMPDSAVSGLKLASLPGTRAPLKCKHSIRCVNFEVNVLDFATVFVTFVRVVSCRCKFVRLRAVHATCTHVFLSWSIDLSI